MTRPHDPTGFPIESTGLTSSGPNLLTLLWRRKALILLGAVAGIILAGIFYARQIPIYQSSAEVLLIEEAASGRSGEMIDAVQASVIDDFVATQLLVIQSHMIIRRALDNPDPLEGHDQPLRNLDTVRDASDPIGLIRSSLSATRVDKQSQQSVIRLTFRGPVAEDCGRIITAIMEEYQNFLEDTYKQRSGQIRKQLETQLQVLNKKLNELYDEQAQFRDDSNLLYQDGQTPIEQTRLLTLKQQEATLEMDVLKLKDQIELIQRKRDAGETLADIIQLLPETDSLSMQLEQQKAQQLFELELKMISLPRSYGPGHPEKESLRRQMQKVEEYYAKLLSSAPKTGANSSLQASNLDDYLRTLNLRLGKAEQELQSVSKLVKSESTAAQQLSKLLFKDEQKRKEISRAEEHYETLVTQLRGISQRADRTGFDAELLTPPGPGGKVAPKLTQTLFAGLALGLLSGLGLAYLAELSDKGFRNPEEIRRRLGLPVIGEIPSLKPDATAEQRKAVGMSVLDPQLCTFYFPRGIEAEAFRSLRTSLYFSTQGHGHQVIQVTSPDTSDGKSTLIANLAVTIAASGRTCVLVDADMRRPRAHEIFGVDNRVGLSTLIAADSSLQQALQPTEIDNLSLLTSGRIPANPAELLTLPRFAEVIEQLRATFDFVLIDTPPLLEVSDPAVVAPRVDAVLLTIRLTKKCGPRATKACEILASIDAKVLGIVVNGIDRRQANQYYGYGHNYGGYQLGSAKGSGYHVAIPEEADDAARLFNRSEG